MMTLSESAETQKDINSERERSRHTFIDDLTALATEHHAQDWRGTFAEFLRDILPKDPNRFARSSHQYIHDMLCRYRDAQRAERIQQTNPDSEPTPATEKALFAGELFGIDSALDRVVDYFKA